jgi:hypothetical protein
VTYVPQLESSGGRGWAARFAPLAAALGVFALLVVALPLLRILSAALVEESSSRARALVDLLAAANETALAEGRAHDVSVDRSWRNRERGAYILTHGRGPGRKTAPEDTTTGSGGSPSSKRREVGIRTTGPPSR